MFPIEDFASCCFSSVTGARTNGSRGALLFVGGAGATWPFSEDPFAFHCKVEALSLQPNIKYVRHSNDFR